VDSNTGGILGKGGLCWPRGAKRLSESAGCLKKVGLGCRLSGEILLQAEKGRGGGYQKACSDREGQNHDKGTEIPRMTELFPGRTKS